MRHIRPSRRGIVLIEDPGGWGQVGWICGTPFDQSIAAVSMLSARPRASETHAPPASLVAVTRNRRPGRRWEPLTGPIGSYDGASLWGGWALLTECREDQCAAMFDSRVVLFGRLFDHALELHGEHTFKKVFHS